jgi:predicted MFS family arabinose efflux permease
MRLRQIFGDDLHPALRPVVAVTFVGSIAGSALWTFAGIWALRRLHAGETRLAWAFVVGAILAATAGYVGGHLSDHIGRRPLILAGWLGETVLAFSLLLVGGHVWLGLGLFTLAGFFGSVGGAADQAMVADLVPPDWHERGYATMRVASNLGTTLGPVIGGLLLLAGSWSALFAGAASIAAVGFLLAVRYIPARGAHAPKSPPSRGSWAVIRRDRTFLTLFAAGCLSSMVYLGFETLLPISLVQEHGLPPSTWGFLVIVNPALVTLFQLRLTRRVERYSPVSRLVLAMLLMGPPFLLLGVSSAVLLVVALLVVFVIGEMLWIPTSQGVVAGLAPEDLRGAYMGAFSATLSIGFALAPFFGLQVLHAYGDTAMWAADTGVALAAAALYAVALRAPRRAEHLARAGAS